MDKDPATRLIRETLQGSFDKERFVDLLRNLLNKFDDSKAFHVKSYVKDKFKPTVRTYERAGTYTDSEDKKTDLLIVYLQQENSIERARTSLRNFIADYLKQRDMKDAALVAFVSPNGTDWRFSLVKMEYKFNKKGKVREEFTPARRYSFLVGKNENSHTAQSRLLPILLNDEDNPTLEQLEDAFSVEKVTREFFEKYRDLFVRIKESMDDIVGRDNAIKADFAKKNIETADFSKKLLGQIVFLYFLQKKGWFGVQRGKGWGSGSKRFLRELFEKKHGNYDNFFNDTLEPLFYEALRLERPKDYYDKFKCRIPFLNGGLFDPINDYDWQDTDIKIPDEIFSNTRRTKEGDAGDGILDVFDRYNFTVKEDEPLEKEVAVDPEMLGKVFENLLEVKDRKSKGAYYTPREIVHYMCQQSLINYLDTECNHGIVVYEKLGDPQTTMIKKEPKKQLHMTIEHRRQPLISKEDIEMLIQYGETSVEHDATYMAKTGKDATYKGKYGKAKLPKSIGEQAKAIDEKLASIRVCDPAVGSGAFVVGMMNEIVRTRNALTPYIGKNRERSPYHFKWQAIQNCLYGVDIDPGAVEIAKLRLWLSLVVDEEEREKIQPLPNLDYKIVQGNSLLGVEKKLFNQHLFKELEDLKPRYFNETNTGKKQKRKKRIDELIREITDGHREFDFEVYFSEVFHEKKGFDVVIANPPYIHIRTKSFDQTTIPLLKKKFALATGQFDYFVLFTELSARILKNGGIYAFIIPKRVLSNQNYQPVRKFYIEYLPVVSYLDAKMPFEFASVETNVLLSQKSAQKQADVTINKFVGDQIEKERSVPLSFATKMPFFIFPFDLTNGDIDLITKINEDCIKLSQIAEITRGYEVGFNHPAISKKDARNNHKIIRGENIGRYYIKFDGFYLNAKLFNKDELKNNVIFSHPKLVTRFVANELIFAYDDVGYHNTNVVYNIRSIDKHTNLKCLLALLNSALVNFWFKKSFLNYDKLFPHIQKNQLEIIPIKDIDSTRKCELIGLADEILGITKTDDYLKNHAKEANVRKYEKQINTLVYQLYNLTDEEIRIIENF